MSSQPFETSTNQTEWSLDALFDLNAESSPPDPELMAELDAVLDMMVTDGTSENCAIEKALDRFFQLSPEETAAFVREQYDEEEDETERSSVDECHAAQENEGSLYFKNLESVLRNATSLLVLSAGTITLNDLYDVITTAASHSEVVNSEAWRTNSQCYKHLERAAEAEKTPEQEVTFKKVSEYFLVEFPALPELFREVVVSTFASVADIFLGRRTRAKNAPVGKRAHAKLVHRIASARLEILKTLVHRTASARLEILKEILAETGASRSNARRVKQIDEVLISYVEQSVAEYLDRYSQTSLSDRKHLLLYLTFYKDIAEVFLQYLPNQSANLQRGGDMAELT